MSQQDPLKNSDPSQVLGKATLRAADALGIKQAQLADVIGRNRSSISRGGIEPQSKSGELALLFLRCYRSLAVLVDDDRAQLRHWFHTTNRHTGGVPAEQIIEVGGLVRVANYLDAIRAKV